MDDDGDGIEDSMDAFPLDVQAWQDTDGDGKADETYKPARCNYQTDGFEADLNSTFQWDLGTSVPWPLRFRVKLRDQSSPDRQRQFGVFDFLSGNKRV